MRKVFFFLTILVLGIFMIQPVLVAYVFPNLDENYCMFSFGTGILSDGKPANLRDVCHMNYAIQHSDFKSCQYFETVGKQEELNKCAQDVSILTANYYCGELYDMDSRFKCHEHISNNVANFDLLEGVNSYKFFETKSLGYKDKFFKSEVALKRNGNIAISDSDGPSSVNCADSINPPDSLISGYEEYGVNKKVYITGCSIERERIVIEYYTYDLAREIS